MLDSVAWEHSCFIKLFVRTFQTPGRGQETVNQYTDSGVDESDKRTACVIAVSWELT